MFGNCIGVQLVLGVLSLCNHLDWEERDGCFTFLSSWCLATS